jgi:uroporphyrin-3 C-methyltransferase
VTEETSQLPATPVVATENTTEPNNNPDLQQQVKSPKVWPLWLALLLVILLIAGGASWFWFYLQTWQSRLNQAISQTESSSNLLNQSGQRYEARMGQIDSDIQKNRNEVNEVRKQLEQTARRILTVGETGRTDWLLAEAEYLLRLANQRLHMEKDYEGSLAILQSADGVLAETKEVATFPIRKVIAEEVISLQTVADVDRQGIFLRLEAMINQLTKLDDALFFTDAPLLNDPPVNSEDVAEPSWYAKALRTLKEHLVIRRLDHEVKPLPAPDQIYYLKQNLRLMLEQAGLALLDKDQQIYLQSLNKAEAWVKDYFLSREPATKAMLKNLEDLKTEQIDPPLPDISQSLRLLRNLLETVYKRGASGKEVGKLLTHAREPGLS